MANSSVGHVPHRVSDMPCQPRRNSFSLSGMSLKAKTASLVGTLSIHRRTLTLARISKEQNVPNAQGCSICAMPRSQKFNRPISENACSNVLPLRDHASSYFIPRTCESSVFLGQQKSEGPNHAE